MFICLLCLLFRRYVIIFYLCLAFQSCYVCLLCCISETLSFIFLDLFPVFKLVKLIYMYLSIMCCISETL